VSVSNTTFAGSEIDENDDKFTFEYDKNNYKALVGKRIDANISVEGQYLNFAETDLDSEVENGTLSEAIKMSGRSVGVAGLYYFEPQEEFSPFAKLGVHSWNTELKVTDLTEKVSGTDVLYGLGADGKINDTVKYRVEFENLELDGVDFDVFSVGLLFDY
jgi:hypothetical protein